jgi:hypothetical protein
MSLLNLYDFWSSPGTATNWEYLPMQFDYLFVPNVQHRWTCQPYSGIEPLRPPCTSPMKVLIGVF